MSLPEDLQYTQDHEWLRQDGAHAVIGITAHAQKQLGDVVFVELPEPGARIEQGEVFGTVESVKAVSDLVAPVTGKVVEVNGNLEGQPEAVNQEPYGGGWMLKVKLEDESAPQTLLDVVAYQKHIDG